MTRKFIRRSSLGFTILVLATLELVFAFPTSAQAFSTIAFSYNCSLATCIRQETPWPSGEVTLGGVSFTIPNGLNIYNFHGPYGTGSNPRTLDIPVNLYGVDRIYTLINTIGGQLGPNAYAWVEFWGKGGAYYRKDLVGNVDIRDYNYDSWTNDINGTTTTNVFLWNQGWYNRHYRKPNSQ